MAIKWYYTKIPESNIQYIEGYRLTDKFPDHYILDYDINNFKIYINSGDYFPSKLPKINITTDYNKADWAILKVIIKCVLQFIVHLIAVECQQSI